MEQFNVLKSSLVNFTVNKCNYCHKPILNQIWSVNKSYLPASKYFCCEECLTLYKKKSKKLMSMQIRH